MSELRIDVSSIGGLAEEPPNLVGITESIPYPGTDFHVVDAEEPISFGSRCAKRSLDLLIAVPAFMFLLPVMLVLALIIRTQSKGKALYCAMRVGKNNVPFKCYKLRTMVMGADALKETLRHLNYRRGATFKVEDDPRITPFGRILRKFSLDELPQLWNVIIGDMSIVGPRPHPIDDIARYSSEDLRRHRVKPGLTGLWQVSARRDPSFRRNMKLDNLYIDTWSFWTDLTIISKTFQVVVRGDGE